MGTNNNSKEPCLKKPYFFQPENDIHDENSSKPRRTCFLTFRLCSRQRTQPDIRRNQKRYRNLAYQTLNMPLGYGVKNQLNRMRY